jgi:hypothetical protein
MEFFGMELGLGSAKPIDKVQLSKFAEELEEFTV